MAGFQSIELAADEKIVFGPITTTRTTSVSGSSGSGQGGSLSRTSGRTVGITNQRLIVEDPGSPDKTVIVPNPDVQRLFVQRRTRQNQTTLTLVRAEALSGQTVKLDIKGLPAQAESMLSETFPNAEVVVGKGGGSKAISSWASSSGRSSSWDACCRRRSCGSPSSRAVSVEVFSGPGRSPSPGGR